MGIGWLWHFSHTDDTRLRSLNEARAADFYARWRAVCERTAAVVALPSRLRNAWRERGRARAARHELEGLSEHVRRDIGWSFAAIDEQAVNRHRADRASWALDSDPASAPDSVSRFAAESVPEFVPKSASESVTDSVPDSAPMSARESVPVSASATLPASASSTLPASASAPAASTASALAPITAPAMAPASESAPMRESESEPSSWPTLREAVRDARGTITTLAVGDVPDDNVGDAPDGGEEGKRPHAA